MVVARRRRRRRPIWVFLAAFLTLVVLAVNAAASSGSRETERRMATVAYLDEVRPLVDRSTRQGADLEDLRQKAGTLGRATVTRRLRKVTAEAGSVLGAAERLEVPDELKTSHALLVATLAIRARSAALIQRAISAGLDPTRPPPPTSDLVEVSEDLLAADRSYKVFVDALPKVGDARLPQSRWLQGPPMTDGEAAAFFASLRSSASLAPVRDVAVVLVSYEPAPVAKEGDAVVLPAARTLKLHVVVANVGNDEVRRVPVVAATGLPDGNVDTARQFVNLGPGERTTITVGGLRVQPNMPVSVAVRAEPVSGETNLADNERRQTVVLR